jgi:hypothetical protein
LTGKKVAIKIFNDYGFSADKKNHLEKLKDLIKIMCIPIPSKRPLK